mmetsp:Transcript_13349/g.20272  ORF Transcript_13349/g.20272 Transcript_13349/m.20272 type:complete len:82 (-) Transcript_13349:356-601(-)
MRVWYMEFTLSRTYVQFSEGESLRSSISYKSVEWDVFAVKKLRSIFSSHPVSFFCLIGSGMSGFGNQIWIAKKGRLLQQSD